MMNLLRLGLVGILFSAQMGLASAETVVTGAVADAHEATAMSEATTEVMASVAPVVEDQNSLSEEQIPLNVEMTKKSIDAATGSTRLFMTVFILLSIMGGTYYMVRRYKLSNNINKSNTRIKVLSQHYLGPKKSLAIIHVAGESMLIGVTDSNISMIKSLSLIDDEVPAELPQNFSDTLQIKAEPKMKAERPAGATARAAVTAVEELEEEFSFSGVKDSVSKKLKSMRNL